MLVWTRTNLRCLALVVFIFMAPGCVGRDAPSIEVFPQHFHLRPGERIHYTPMERTLEGEMRFFEDYEFEANDARVLRLLDRTGVFEAVAQGRTDVVVKSPRAERRFRVEVRGDPLRGMTTVHHQEVDEIGGSELLFVGHANLDGFDHTAVAKPGIDRWVREFKARGRPVVYWVSDEYPNWYTEDRQPDVAIVSEGQEHQVRIDAERVVFTGGGFMLCLLRNAQMTLHGMLQDEGAEQVHFVFPADAIWMADIWGPGARRGYPAPTLLLSTLFDDRASDEVAYAEIVVPFLDRLFTDFPVEGYPSSAPEPHLSALVDRWNVTVRLSDTFERTYRRARSTKTIIMEFDLTTASL